MLFLFLNSDQQKKALQKMHMLLVLQYAYEVIQQSLLKNSWQHCQCIKGKCGCSGAVLQVGSCSTARVINESLQEMITPLNFNIWITCTMVPFTFMLKLKRSAGKHYVIIKSVHVICPTINLPLRKFRRKIMSSYPHTEGGQLLTTSQK